MKKKILMLIMAVTMICLVGCGKEKTQVNPNVPEAPNDIIDAEIKSGENSNELVGTSGDVMLEEISNSYQRVQDILPEEIQNFVPFICNIEMFFESENGANPIDYGVSSLLTNLKGKSDPYASISYLLKDLNGDGLEELMLFNNTATGKNKNAILSMYTIVGEEYNHILNSNENNLFKLCENNVIKNETLLDEGEFTLYYNINKEYGLELIEGSDTEYKELELKLIPLK